MVKTLSSQQMDSGQTKKISQRVESDASPTSPNSSICFGVPSAVTQYENYVQEEEHIEDIIVNSEPEGQVQDSIVAHKSKRTIQKLTQFSDMMVVNVLSVEVVKDNVLCSFREAELSSKSELWRNSMVEEIEPLHFSNT